MIAVVLAVALAGTGCASAAGPRMTAAAQPRVVDTRAMADYVTRLPAGSKVRVETLDGSSFRGTLMKATDDAIVVQKNTRVPEPPIDVPMAHIARVTVNGGGGSPAKAIGIGIASGVGAFVGILAILAATLDD